MKLTPATIGQVLELIAMVTAVTLALVLAFASSPAKHHPTPTTSYCASPGGYVWQGTTYQYSREWFMPCSWSNQERDI